MTKWEYCKTEILYNLNKHTTLARLSFIGKNYIDLEENIDNLIAKLGIEGWEMISHSQVYDSNNTSMTFYFFKRPL